MGTTESKAPCSHVAPFLRLPPVPYTIKGLRLIRETAYGGIYEYDATRVCKVSNTKAKTLSMQDKLTLATQRGLRACVECPFAETLFLVDSMSWASSRLVRCLGWNKDDQLGPIRLLLERATCDLFDWRSKHTLEEFLAQLPTLVVHVLSALDSMHSHGYAHMDISPENIFLFPSASKTRRSSLFVTPALSFDLDTKAAHVQTSGPKTKTHRRTASTVPAVSKLSGHEEWEFKLGDFGSCLQCTADTMVPAGSPLRGKDSYMDPDIRAKRAYSPQLSDIYSFGLVLQSLAKFQKSLDHLKEPPLGNSFLRRLLDVMLLPRESRWTARRILDAIHKHSF